MAKRKQRRSASARNRRTAGTKRTTTKKRAAARPSRSATRRTARKAAARRPASARASAARKSASRPKAAQTSRTAAPARKAPARKAPAPAAKVLRKRPSVQHRLHLDRARRTLEEPVPGPPSSLDLDRHASAARTGRAEMREALSQHTESSPQLTGGDVDANWASAFSTGDEAPGGDMPTPDQDVVEEIGSSLGVQYADDEELKGVDKIAERDRHRWELDPASAEDYRERSGKKERT